MSYLEHLVLAFTSLLASGALLVGSGVADRRLGYDSAFKPFCLLGLLAAVGSALWLFIVLLPYVVFLLIALLFIGIGLTLVGVAKGYIL